MKTTDFIVEYAGIGNDAEAMGLDHEVQLARQDLYNTAKHAIELHARLKNISEETGLEGWVSEKITLAADYLASVSDYFAEQDQPDMDLLDSFSFEAAEQQYDQLVNESAGDQAWSAGYQAFLDDVVKCPYPAGSDNAHTWSLGWESAQSRERTSESAEHPDEEEDKKLIKKMVKPSALKDGKVDEAFPHDVVKGIKRKVAGKQDPKEVQYQHGFRARQAIDASRKFNNQAAYDNEKKMVDRYNKVHKVVNKEGVAEGSDELYQKAIRKYVQQVANDYLGGGSDHLYGANKFDSEMFGVSPKQAHQDFDKLFPLYVKKLQGVAEGYTVTRGIDRERYQERAGLEGPFATKIGKVVYYDPREGKYYDPDTDMYIEYNDWKSMNEASDPSGIFTAAQHNHAFIVTAEVDSKRKKFRVYHQNANLAKQKFLQHHSMATVLDVKPEATKGVTEESDDDSFNAAYVAGLRHGSAGVGNNMDRAKKEWGSSFADYNRGFLKGRNSKAKSLKATGQGYGKKQQVTELNYDRHADSQWNPTATNPLAAAAPFIVINKKTRLPVTKQTFPSARDAMQFIKGNPDLTMVRQGSKVSENELTELSTATLNAYIPKANRSRDQATKDMQATGKYDPKVDDKMGRRAEFTMKAKNKVNEDGGEPVVESASAGGTSAGAIATGVAGAKAGKPGTGKPKKVSNVIKRNKPAFGKGIY